MDIDKLLQLMINKNGSDLFITADVAPSMKINGKTIEMVGIIWHFGSGCASSGDSCNMLTPHIGDPNTGIPEFKAFLVNIEKA